MGHSPSWEANMSSDSLDIPPHFMEHVISWSPVTTAWRVLKLRMEERPEDTESNCEYIE
jgi:hypothetical protein